MLPTYNDVASIMNTLSPLSRFEFRMHLASGGMSLPPRFGVGDRVRIIGVLDTLTTHNIIGFVGRVTEVETLPNGDHIYGLRGEQGQTHSPIHEDELEPA